jgi:NAD kinase
MAASRKVRFVLVSRKTRLQELTERFNTWPQAKFYLEHAHVDAEDYLREHDVYVRQLLEAERILKGQGRFQLLERGFLPDYRFSPDDIVVVVGQDGLVANTLKYLSGQPVIGVNPDPQRWEGRLLPFVPAELAEVVQRTLAGKTRCQSITFAEARTNDGQRLLGVNDLFIGPKSHTSARYALQWHGQQEEQSSSGIIVSTGFGSSGWFKSILAGAVGVTRGVTGQESHPLANGFDWQARKLYFTVREPFPSRTSGARLVFGAIEGEDCLRLESHMPENGVVFSDGIESDYLNFNSGTILTVGVAADRGQLIVR